MTTYEQPMMQRFSQVHLDVHQGPHPYSTATQPFYDQVPLQNNVKSEILVEESCVEKKQKGHLPRKRYYVPNALRTGCLVAFCIVTFIVFALLQAVSIAYVKAGGLEALAIDSSNSKREAYPQTSSTSCPTGATCAPAPGSWTYPTRSASPRSAPPTAPAPGSFSKPISIYFFGAYAPTLLAILLSIWWKCVFARLKEMEPYYQLAQRHGASSRDSLFLSYSSDMLPVALVKSYRSMHWATFIGAANMLLLTIVTLFAAEALHLIGVGDGCGVVVDAEGDSNGDCEMQPTVRPALGFMLGAILLAVLVGTVVLMVRMRRYPSGLVSEATSIAGIASLSTSAITQGSLHSLQSPGRRFALGLSEVDGTRSIIEITPAVQQPMILVPDYSQVSLSPKRKSRIEMRSVSLTLFALYQIAILVLVLYYRYVSTPGTNNPIEDFMNSESFGVRLFMTCLGLGTKFYWGWIEKYVRHMSPYVALAAPGGASARKSVLMTTHSHPVTALFSRNTWRHGLLGPVTVMAVLSEILVITLNTVPFTDTTAYTAFEVSVYFCVIILGLMILTVPGVIWWALRVRKNDNVADVPECIADVLRMTTDTEIWRGLNGMSGKERTKVINSWQAQFATRRVEGNWRIVTV